MSNHFRQPMTEETDHPEYVIVWVMAAVVLFALAAAIWWAV